MHPEIGIREAFLNFLEFTREFIKLLFLSLLFTWPNEKFKFFNSTLFNERIMTVSHDAQSLAITQE
jgi:hypothetical protein